MYKTIAVIATVLVTGCAGNAPISVMYADEATVRSHTDVNLCKTYALMNTNTRNASTVGKELQHRLGSEWAIINTHQIQIGLSEAGLLCSWGHPDRVNTSTGSWGVNKQFVYGRQYVYTTNGRVTSWQSNG